MKIIRIGLLMTAVFGMAQTAVAADVAFKARPAPPVYNWQGFYAGAHAGWGFNDGSASALSTIPAGAWLASGPHALSDDGPMFGGHLGYNWQLGQSWVLGIEGDMTGTGLRGVANGGGVCTGVAVCAAGLPIPGALHAFSQDVNWLASIRGRIGYTWGPGMMYFTGGGAWADVERTANHGDALTCAAPGGVTCAFPVASDSILTGWTIGGGYEHMITHNWLVRVEYLYYSLDGAETLASTINAAGGCGVAFCTTTYTFPDLDIHTLRVGLSYKF